MAVPGISRAPEPRFNAYMRSNVRAQIDRSAIHVSSRQVATVLAPQRFLSSTALTRPAAPSVSHDRHTIDYCVLPLHTTTATAAPATAATAKPAAPPRKSQAKWRRAALKVGRQLLQMARKAKEAPKAYVDLQLFESFSC